MAATDIQATKLPVPASCKPGTVVFGVFATSDPRIDDASRQRCVNICGHVANVIAKCVRMPDGTAVKVVWTPVLVDGEKQADIVARQFKDAGVQALVCCPDTWAFPQPTAISLLSHFPWNMPLNITCGNSGPKPGVVFAQALNGALAQMGRLSSLNVGTWPDTGMDPQMMPATAEALVDWCYAALTYAGLRGRRVVVFGHDSMGMETALPHILAMRHTFGIEVTRLDMKLLADMLTKRAYDEKELMEFRTWINRHIGHRLELRGPGDGERFDQSLAMYLIVRDLMADINAVGGGFMSQLEWGSDMRGTPLPVADGMESLLNSTFDHRGRKPPLPYATEADVQGLLTMLFMTWLSGGSPPLFMDFRKVWEPWEIQALAKKLGVRFTKKDIWAELGCFDGDNSGSASFDWAGRPGEDPDEVMKRISMPLADPGYFPGGGNSVTFNTPGGIECVTGRLHYDHGPDRFSLLWDETVTAGLPEKLARAVAATSTPTWPHTFVIALIASMTQWKQYAPANHVHSVWGLKPARLQHWMDMSGVRDGHASRWPVFRPGIDRPMPLRELVRML